jgi:hypothetical protein
VDLLRSYQRNDREVFGLCKDFVKRRGIAKTRPLPCILSQRCPVNCSRKNQEVQWERPTADHEKVKPSPLRVIQPASAANLPETRNARFFGKEQCGITPVVVFDLAPSKRPRSYQSHLPAYHLPELRQFIDGKASANDRKRTCHARVPTGFDDCRPRFIVRESFNQTVCRSSAAVTPHGS